MSTVQTARLTNWLRRALALHDSVGLEYFPDLLPVIPIALADDPSMQWWRGERAWAASVRGAATAGQNSFVGLRNPAGSNYLAVIEAVKHSGQAAMEMRWGLLDTAGFTATVDLNRLTQRDARSTADLLMTPICVPVQGAAAANPLSASAAWVVAGALPADGTRRELVRIVVPPGMTALFGGQTVNTQVDGYFEWRERPAELEELR